MFLALNHCNQFPPPPLFHCSLEQKLNHNISIFPEVVFLDYCDNCKFSRATHGIWNIYLSLMNENHYIIFPHTKLCYIWGEKTGKFRMKHPIWKTIYITYAAKTWCINSNWIIHPINHIRVLTVTSIWFMLMMPSPFIWANFL